MYHSFFAGILYDKYVYFSDLHSNGIYKMNPQTGECFLLNIFQEEENISALHDSAFIYEDTIWFIPYN